MKPQKTLMLITLCMGATIFNGCKKDDDNSYVKSGTNNNTVKNYSLIVHSSDWYYDNIETQWFYKYYCSENAQSAVLGYVMSGNGKQAMTYYDNLYGLNYTFANDLFQSSPYIQFQVTNYNNVATRPSSDTYLYLVIIPPSQRKAHPEVNYGNYNSVKRAFNLGEPVSAKQ